MKGKWLFLISVCAAILYFGILLFPQVLFAKKYSYRNFEVYSDKNIPTEIEHVLDDVNKRISKSELYNKDDRFRIFIANDTWRLMLFTRNTNVGGQCDFSLTRSAYIRESDIASNRIVPPKTWRFPLSDRPLSYFIAHELTHVMQSKSDRWLNMKVPTHILEGYADYIGKSTEFDFDEYYSKWETNAAIMNPENGLYNKYHLFVAYLMDKKGMSFKQLVETKPELTRMEEIRNLE